MADHDGVGVATAELFVGKLELLVELLDRVGRRISLRGRSRHGQLRQTAERFFNGDLQALLRHYRSSDDPVFNSDANSIESLMIRNELLENEWQALQAPWAQRTWHVLVQADPQLREETLNGYSYQILLVPEAVGWGLGAGFVLAFVIESLLLAIGWVILGGRRGAVKESWR